METVAPARCPPAAPTGPLDVSLADCQDPALQVHHASSRKTLSSGCSDTHGLPLDLHSLAAQARAGFTAPAAWVLVFGWTLANCAGVVNVITFTRWHRLVSPMTGNTTKLGLMLQAWHSRKQTFDEVATPLFLVISFVGGAFLCGVLIDKNTVHFGGKSFYGIALVLNSVLLVIACLHDGDYSIYLAAVACGLQNAMCTSHFGAVVRTTHMTGALTDVGSTMGRAAMVYLRRGCRPSRLNVLDRAEIEVDLMKLMVLVTLFLCYLLGCTCGAYLQEFLGHRALLVPAGITGLIGFLYMFFREAMMRQVKQYEQERLHRELGRVKRGLQCLRLWSKSRDRAGVEPDTEQLDDLKNLCSEVSHVAEALEDVERIVGSAGPGSSGGPRAQQGQLRESKQ